MASRKRTAPQPKQSLGSRIRRYRLEKGLTQTQLGKKIGVSQRVVAYYEAKGISPPPDLLVRIADVLGVSTDTLLGRKKKSDRAGNEPAGNVRRQRHFKRLEDLPLYDRKAIFRIIDALADRHGKPRGS